GSMSAPTRPISLPAGLASRQRTFGAGAELFAPGAPATEAWLLTEGRVSVAEPVGDRELTIALARPGDLLGEEGLLPGETRRRRAVAVLDSRLLPVSAAELAPLVAATPELGAILVSALARRLTELDARSRVLLLTDSRARVVSALARLARKALGVGAPGPGADLDVTPLELGVEVGVDVETVKRIVHQLQDSGHLHISGEQLRVADASTLRSLAELLESQEPLAAAADASGPRTGGRP
ncbi:MAG: Crp/Fnr family transcriptional regulator, partial [Deltaproteobacteria bacterium]|nr:Crp/Fnr family transcriptional regulator [Deltaproteobacteria bacterium]